MGLDTAKLMILDGRPTVFSGSNDVDPHPLPSNKESLMRASMAAAAVSNPLIEKPWGPAPSWTSATSYRQGVVVRGVGAGNTNNLFVQVEGGTQTTGAGPGPVGEQTTGITTDGTCRWLYIGKTNAEGSIQPWSTVTPAVATDVMDGYLAKVLTANLTALGLTRQYNNLLSDSVVRWTGGVQYDLSGQISIRGPNGATAAAPNFVTSAEYWTMHFQTDCRKWLAIQPVTGIPQQAFTIEVNGRRLSEGQLVNSSAFVGGGSLMLDLSSFPAGPKDIKFYSINSVRDWFIRMWVGADENIWTPTPINNIRMAFEGDSITQGSGTADKLGINRTERLLCNMLGIENYFNNAVGGTGVISNNSNNATTYIQRLASIIEFKPDILLIGGFHNDADKGGTSEVRRTAVLTYLRAVRAALPECTVFLVGAQMLGGESLTAGVSTMFDMETEAKAAFDDWNDPNSAFIRTVTSSPYKFPGSTGSNTWFYQLAGASPFNDSHPTPRYYPSYAAFVAKEIKKFFD